MMTRWMVTMALLAAVGCQGDKKDDPAPVGPAPQAQDESAPEETTGGDAPLATGTVTQEATVAAPAGGGETSHPTGRPPDAHIYNRVIVKVLPERAADLDEAALIKLVEDKTGQKVDRVRGGAVGMTLVVFAPKEPPRTAEDQAALVEKLKGASVFKYVEADRMLKAKGKGEQAAPKGEQAAPQTGW